MQTLAQILNGIAALIMLLMIIGLINPNWINFKKDNSNSFSRKQIALAGVVIIFLLLAIISAIDPKSIEHKTTAQNVVEKIEQPKPKENTNIEITKKTEVQAETEPNLGITPEQFRKAFNDRLSKIDLSHLNHLQSFADISYLRPLAEFNIVEGASKNTIHIHITDSIDMIATETKNGLLSEVVFVLGHSEKPEESFLEIVLLSSLMTQVLNPETKQGIASKTMINLINSAVKDINKVDSKHTKTFGKNKYYAMASKELGLWVGVAPSKPN